MKKFLINIVFVMIFCNIFFLQSASADAINIDTSGSICRVTGQNRITINNLFLSGYSEVYGNIWAEFEWSPSQLVFYPINGGEEQKYSAWKCETTMGFNKQRAKFTLINDTANNVITVAITGVEGSFWTCPNNLSLAQGDGNNFFELNPYRWNYNTASAEGLNGYDLSCGNIAIGETKALLISHIPEWFNLSYEFHLKYIYPNVSNLSINCTPR